MVCTNLATRRRWQSNIEFSNAISKICGRVRRVFARWNARPSRQTVMDNQWREPEGAALVALVPWGDRYVADRAGRLGDPVPSGIIPGSWGGWVNFWWPRWAASDGR
jgi:hypothetical protein